MIFFFDKVKVFNLTFDQFNPFLSETKKNTKYIAVAVINFTTTMFPHKTVLI